MILPNKELLVKREVERKHVFIPLALVVFLLLCMLFYLRYVNANKAFQRFRRQEKKQNNSSAWIRSLGRKKNTPSRSRASNPVSRARISLRTPTPLRPEISRPNATIARRNEPTENVCQEHTEYNLPSTPPPIYTPMAKNGDVCIGNEYARDVDVMETNGMGDTYGMGAANGMGDTNTEAHIQSSPAYVRN